ncbi:PASTA domain-containing protein [uncultured Aliiroseovarius sp.]|uniref:PASTA domain-containing protein n=1 Tax=uncultured Aliiroseovarius sp. TaxID=1658783 RepID=UPI00341AB02B
MGIVGTHHLLVAEVLEEAGIDFQVSFDNDVCSSVSRNEVYKIIPGEGEVLSGDNPLVVLRVLRSTKLVTVPDLSGLSLESARGAVEGIGLRFHDGGSKGPRRGDWCGIYTDRQTSSDVRQQEPESGNSLACGETVTAYKEWWGTWQSQRASNGQCM